MNQSYTKDFQYFLKKIEKIDWLILSVMIYFNTIPKIRLTKDLSYSVNKKTENSFRISQRCG